MYLQIGTSKIILKISAQKYITILFVSVDAEDLKYYVPGTFWMKFRLLLFWMLWTMLIIAMMICLLTYFCFIPFVVSQVCYTNIQEDV